MGLSESSGVDKANSEVVADDGTLGEGETETLRVEGGESCLLTEGSSNASEIGRRIRSTSRIWQ